MPMNAFPPDVYRDAECSGPRVLSILERVGQYDMADAPLDREALAYNMSPVIVTRHQPPRTIETIKMKLPSGEWVEL